MTRIIAFALRAGGAAAGAYTLGRMPAEVYAPLLEKLGIADAPWLTPANEAIALYAIGALFGLLFGSVVAGLMPNGSREPVGTREEAAASVPRLRRHLGNGQVADKSSGSPLDRLSAPPAGQQLPKHDLSNIPPAPSEDEISFERIPNTGVYADVESHVDFELGEDDEDLKRFAAARIVDEPPAGTGWDDDDWSEDEWTRPEAEIHASGQPAFEVPEQPVENEFAAFDNGAAEPVAKEEPQWPANIPMPPTLEEQGWGEMQRPAAQDAQAFEAVEDESMAAPAEEAWPAGIPMPPTLEEQGWGQINRQPASAPSAATFEPASFASPDPADPSSQAAPAAFADAQVAEETESAFGASNESLANSSEEEWAAFNQPVPEHEPAEAETDAVDFSARDDMEERDIPAHADVVEPEEAPAAPDWNEAVNEPQFAPQMSPAAEPEFRAEPEPQVVSLHGNDGYRGHDGVSAPRFAPGLTGGADEDWFAGEADEEEDADDDGAGYGSLMAIGLGKTHKPRPKQPSHRLGEANLSHSPLLDVDRDMGGIPQGAGPQDFRLREALEGLKRF